MNPLVVTLVTALLIVASAFFVIIEFALIGARRHRLEQQAERSAAARAALRGMNELTMMLAVAQLGITVCTFALGAITKPAVDAVLAPVFASWGLPEWLAGGAAFALALVFVTFLHLVIGEMVPKSWAIAHPETAAKLIGVPGQALLWLLRPMLHWINKLANALVARTGVEPVDRAAVGGRDAETIRNLVEYSTQVGALQPELRTQLTEAIELERLTAGEITVTGRTPTAVDAGATVAELHAASRASGHLRVLVREGERLPRFVHVRDTLLAGADEQVAAFARPALVVDAALGVAELLRRMREEAVQLAVVERGGAVVGILTVTDILRRVLPATSGGVARV